MVLRYCINGNVDMAHALSRRWKVFLFFAIPIVPYYVFLGVAVFGWALIGMLFLLCWLLDI